MSITIPEPGWAIALVPNNTENIKITNAFTAEVERSILNYLYKGIEKSFIKEAN
jgi:hypothetical protein